MLKKYLSLHNVIALAILVTSVIVLGRVLPGTGSLQKDLYTQKLFEARVVRVVGDERDPNVQAGQRSQLVQTLSIDVNLIDKHKEVEIKNDFVPLSVGETIYVKASGLGTENESFDISDVKRKGGLIWLTLLFMIFAVAVGGIKGLKALIGLVASLAIIFGFIIPRILDGGDAVRIALFASLAIVFISIYLADGLTKKSLIAIGGIFITVLFTAWLTQFSIDRMHFSGYNVEEVIYLNSETGNAINLVGILVAGILISALGILDDVAVTQVSVVSQLAKANPTFRKLQLFRKAMSVGRDHIAAVINTLALAYVGASLPLLLLLTTQQFAIGFTINTEPVATEIVRTLIATSSLVLAVPVTTLLAAYFTPRFRQDE